jgi:DHA2 family methylenomycin A resistance protein-like MFS transporter
MMKSTIRTIQVITLVVTGLATFMVLLDGSVVIVALPTIQASLHAQLSDLQWTYDAYTLPFAALLLTAGTLGDRFGRKRIFLIGLVLFLIGSTICGFAGNLAWLIFGRVIQGVGAATLAPGSLSLVVSSFSEPRARAQAIGIWSGVSGVSLAAGPLVGGVIIQSASWPAIFLMNLPLGLAALLLGWPLLVDSRNPDARRIDVLGQVLVIGALTCLIMALIQAPSLGWTSPLILGLFVGSVILLVAFLLVEARVPEPMLPLSLFANSLFSVANLAAALLGVITVGAMFFLAQYFQSVQGDTALVVGLRLLPITLGIFVVSPFAGRITSQSGPRLPITLGALLVAGGFLFLLGLEPNSGYGMLWWQLSLIGIGIGFMFAPLTVAVTSATPLSRAGLGASMLNTFRVFGFAIGTAVLGTLVVVQFMGNILSQLVQRGVPTATSAAIARKVASAGAQASKVALPEHLPFSPAVLHQVLNQAFVDAIHGAFLVSAVCMIVTALLFALINRNTQPATGKSKAETGVPATTGAGQAEIETPAVLEVRADQVSLEMEENLY